MAERRETPDVLGEILGSPAPTAALSPADAAPTAARRPRPAARPKPALAPTPPAAETEAQIALPPLFGGRRQWEYLHVIFRDYDGWRPYQQAGFRVANWKQGPDIDSYLAVLGEQGWEMAGAASGEHGQLHGFFKRGKS